MINIHKTNNSMGRIEFKSREVWPQEVQPVTPSKPVKASATVKPSPVKTSAPVMVSAAVKASAPKPTELWRNSSVRPELMVSNMGRVKAREYRIVNKQEDGRYRIYDVPAKMLDNSIGPSGELYVHFTNASGNPDMESVAFLVAKEFVPNEDATRYTKLKYRDMDRGNAKASNLYWDGVGIYAQK